jgi:hypothetical protein
VRASRFFDAIAYDESTHMCEPSGAQPICGGRGSTPRLLQMLIRSRWTIFVLAMVAVSGCGSGRIDHSVGVRTLTGSEMDQVRAGSAVSRNEVMGRALGNTSYATVIGDASAYSGSGPLVGLPTLSYASTQGMALAEGENVAQNLLSSGVLIAHGNREVALDGVAISTGTRARATTEIYAISTNPSDLAFGSVNAIGCCGGDAEAASQIFTRSTGLYSTELRSSPVFHSAGERDSRVDAAVVSSALPLLELGRALVAGTPTQISPKY